MRGGDRRSEEDVGERVYTCVFVTKITCNLLSLMCSFHPHFNVTNYLISVTQVEMCHSPFTVLL